MEFLQNNIDWVIAFGSGFLCASIIWIFLITIRLWSDIRKTNKEYLINGSKNDQDKKLSTALGFIESAQDSIRLNKQLNPEWFASCLLYTSPSPRD